MKIFEITIPFSDILFFLNFRSVNFARIGTEIAEKLFEAAYNLGEQYKERILFQENQEYIRETESIPVGHNLFGDAFNCVERWGFLVDLCIASYEKIFLAF